MTGPVDLGDGIWSVTAGSFASNSYIAADGTANGAVLIDVGLDRSAIEAALGALGRTPSAIYCTHGHFDHVGTAAFFQNTYGLQVFLHEEDARTSVANNFLLMLLKSPERVEQPEYTLVTSGFAAAVGDDRLHFRHAPGHTPGSCVIALRDHLFTGDTIYSRGIALAKTAGEKTAQLRSTILGLWDTLPGSIVHPGHGPSSRGEVLQVANRPLRAFLGLEPIPEPAPTIAGSHRG